MVNILWVQKSFAGGSFYHEGTEGTKMVDNLELATRIYVELCGQQFNDVCDPNRKRIDRTTMFAHAALDAAHVFAAVEAKYHPPKDI